MVETNSSTKFHSGHYDNIGYTTQQYPSVEVASLELNQENNCLGSVACYEHLHSLFPIGCSLVLCGFSSTF